MCSMRWDSEPIIANLVAVIKSKQANQKKCKKSQTGMPSNKLGSDQ